MYDFCALPRDQQSALLAEYRASLPAARQRFVELVAGEAPGASLDGRLPSLIAANEFFLHKIVAPAVARAG